MPFHHLDKHSLIGLLDRVVRAVALLAVIVWSVTLPSQARALTIDEIDNLLLAYYPFSGNTDDATGRHAPGDLYGGATLTADRDGIADYAYNFDGVDGYIDLGTPEDLMFTGAFTVAAWIRPEAGALLSHPDIVVRTGTPGYYSWSLRLYWANPEGWVSGSGGPSHTLAQGPDDLVAGTWYHMAMTYEPSSALKVYLGGELVAHETLSVPASLYDPDGVSVRIGANWYGGDPGNPGNQFAGDIDEVRIYQGALDADEVEALVPEPTTALLLAVGLAGLAAARQRRSLH